MVTTGMRNQRFPVVVSDLLSQIAICDLHQRVRAILEGNAASVSEEVLEATLKSHEDRYEMRGRSGPDRHRDREA
jgi:hypothetical protein